MTYEVDDYIEQNKNLTIFFKEYIGEPKLPPFISYPNKSTKYPIRITDLRYQSHHRTPRNYQQFLEDGTDLENARLFLILNGRREIDDEEIDERSDENKLGEVKVE